MELQVFTCLSDLADFWTQTATGQFVHNGDCLTDSGSKASLQTCTAGDTSQYWTSAGSAFELVNKGAPACLGPHGARGQPPAAPADHPAARAATRRSTSSRPRAVQIAARSGLCRVPVIATLMTAEASAMDPG
jgi:hypothetical protein